MIPRNLAVAAGMLLALAVGMSLYLWQLRRHPHAETDTAVTRSTHIAPPASGPMEKVTVVVADDLHQSLQPRTLLIAPASSRQARAFQLLQGLLDVYQAKDSPHPVAAAADIRGVYLTNSGMAVVDVNTAFADGQTSGVLAEELTIASLVQTLSVNFPGVTKVRILVGGKERETLAGHADLSGSYDAAQVSELAKQLWAQ